MFCYVSTMALGLGLFSLTVAVSICCIYTCSAQLYKQRTSPALMFGESICISGEGRGWGQSLGSAQHFGKPFLAEEYCEALCPSLAVFTFTLCYVYMVDRQNLLIWLVPLRSVV